MQTFFSDQFRMSQFDPGQTLSRFFHGMTIQPEEDFEAGSIPLHNKTDPDE